MRERPAHRHRCLLCGAVGGGRGTLLRTSGFRALSPCVESPPLSTAFALCSIPSPLPTWSAAHGQRESRGASTHFVSPGLSLRFFHKNGVCWYSNNMENGLFPAISQFIRKVFHVDAGDVDAGGGCSADMSRHSVSPAGKALTALHFQCVQITIRNIRSVRETCRDAVFFCLRQEKSPDRAACIFLVAININSRNTFIH